MKKKQTQAGNPQLEAGGARSPAVAATDGDTAPVLAFPVVGIGASAGGLAAFESFFAGMPADAAPGMAFVLVQHLAPEHKSILSALVQRYTSMEVFEVVDGMVVRPNCAYVIPPGRDMAFLNGSLQLLDPVEPHGHRLPIDFFFRSLAHDQRERAIGIVLSGTGSDGSLGVRAIKGEGGMVMVQTTASAEFDGMPASALATGLVDYTLPPAEMPARLIAYARHAYGRLPLTGVDPQLKADSAMKKIFVLLRAQTGHDFSQYKPSTIHRRIDRRMAVQQIDDLPSYVRYLQQTPPEVESLFRDLLIGVTNFFRDPEVFQVLEKRVIPRLFEGKRPGDTIRVWTVGCSTGEEAYSIAILLIERMEVLKQNFTVQIFATDIDSEAITTARAGLYPASIAADVTAERLARYFTVENDGGAYRILRSVRDLLVFSEQNVIKDPPFSRLDLISCRNLLIYMDGDLQKRVIPLFHYSLVPGGMLFLGTSEGINDYDDLFAVVDRKAKIYQRRDDQYRQHRSILSRILPPIGMLDAPLAPNVSKPRTDDKPPLRELTEQSLLQHLAPVGVLVNGRGDILYLHGRTGMYLEPAPGEVRINNMLKMAREGLRPGLVSALHKAIASRGVIRSLGLRVKTNGHYTTVNLTVRPVTIGLYSKAEPSLYLVILEEAPVIELEARPAVAQAAAQAAAVAAPELDAEARIAALRQELHIREEYLHSTHEELESSTEELKSSNEEMQSVNEELQSTNEELETSKEELQSVNEEMTTVNAELQNKVADLSRANNDMNNLLAGTGIGTVFVDHQLRILRFTPAVRSIINLIPSDVGRPVAHTVANFVNYSALVAEAQEVLDTLVPKVVEVQTTAGAWYMMRIQPYRTLDNVIEGIVISFVDITEMRRMREALQKSNEWMRLAVVVRDAHDAITVQDLDGRIIAWNPGAVRIYGWSEAEALQLNVRDRIPERQRENAVARIYELNNAKVLDPYLTKRLTRDGSIVDVSIISTALRNELGEIYAIATTERQLAEDGEGGKVES